MTKKEKAERHSQNKKKHWQEKEKQKLKAKVKSLRNLQKLHFYRNF